MATDYTYAAHQPYSVAAYSPNSLLDAPLPPVLATHRQRKAGPWEPLADGDVHDATIIITGQLPDPLG
jgi:hypothetical protein